MVLGGSKSKSQSSTASLWLLMKWSVTAEEVQFVAPRQILLADRPQVVDGGAQPRTHHCKRPLIVNRVYDW